MGLFLLAIEFFEPVVQQLLLLCVRAIPCLMHNCLKFDFGSYKNLVLIWCIGINVILKMLF